MSRPTIEGLKAEVLRLQEALKKATDAAEQSERMKKHYSEAAQKSEADVESLGLMLDFLPDAPPREKQGKESWEKIQVPLHIRLASYLAIRN